MWAPHVLTLAGLPSLAEIEELEEEYVDFAAELSCSFVPFEADGKEDDAAPPSWKLSRIPPGLTTQLEAYLKHRTDPFVRARDGTAAQDITVGNDRATVLRSVPLHHAAVPRMPPVS